MQQADAQTAGAKAPGKIEFVLMISFIMMIVAFAIDSMLPALPAMGDALGVPDSNDRQLIITVFLAGFGVAQLFVGVLSDRFGRRGMVLVSLIGFALTNLAATLATSFEMLLAARAAQGMFAAGARVVVTSIVRDRYEGREMAQVMSLSAMLFMIAPILAPSLGAAIVAFGPWRWIFGALALIGAVLWIWIVFRLPETLAVEKRVPINMTEIRSSVRLVVTERNSLGYGLTQAAVSVGLFGFLTTVQPAFEVTFKRPDLLPLGFALMASGMAVSSLLNAAIVRRYGMRKIGHLAMFWFTGMAALHWLIARSGHETLTTFIVLQMLMMMGFSLMAGNFGAMAMEKVGSVAGMASSIQGFFSNIVGAVLGTVVGRSFDGTLAPLYASFVMGGLACILIVYITEGGRFFVAHHAGTPPPVQPE